MSRKNRRKNVRKGETRLNPDERVWRLMGDGEWRTLEDIQEEARVQLVVARRIIDKKGVKSMQLRGDVLYRRSDNEQGVKNGSEKSTTIHC